MHNNLIICNGKQGYMKFIIMICYKTSGSPGATVSCLIYKISIKFLNTFKCDSNILALLSAQSVAFTDVYQLCHINNYLDLDKQEVKN